MNAAENSPRRTIVLATQNPHKVAELRGILGSASGVDLIGLADLVERGEAPAGGFPEPDEHGTTFSQNAAIKALTYAKLTGRWCLADDSGLEVDHLGQSPGVISSHYNTDGRDEGQDRSTRDRLNNERLLRELRGVPFVERRARFVCVMVLASPPTALAPHGRVVAEARGTFEGRIGLAADEAGSDASLRVPRGEGGFGYDPLFLVGPGFERSSAELSAEEKNAVSHRAVAAGRMADLLSRGAAAV